MKKLKGYFVDIYVEKGTQRLLKAITNLGVEVNIVETELVNEDVRVKV